MTKSVSVAAALALAGAMLAVFTSWMIFAWTPIEATQGVIQRINYVHVPVAWLAELAFVLSALFGAVYLWLRDERADAAAVVSAEAGMYFATALLVVGPLWGRVAWGTFWTPEPRLMLTLLLYFIFIGYFMVRGATSDPGRGRRYSAVVAIVGALDIPLIHMSVYWFRSLHPEPVFLRPDGPTADPRIVTTLLVSLLAYTLLFAGLWWLRYVTEIVERSRRRLSPMLQESAP
jgi:heme exporter protein C